MTFPCKCVWIVFYWMTAQAGDHRIVIIVPLMPASTTWAHNFTRWLTLYISISIALGNKLFIFILHLDKKIRSLSKHSVSMYAMCRDDSL